MIKNLFAFLLICLNATLLIQAQTKDSTLKIIKKDTLWRKSFNGGLNINQNNFSNNWQGGGANSFAIGSLINARAYYVKGKTSWDNIIDLQYSRVSTSGLGNRKGNDRIFLDSKYGYGLSKVIGLFAALNFQSQFDKGYKYSNNNGINTQQYLSSFLSPGYLSESVGFDYKPNSWFDVRWGIATLRQTIVRDTALHQYVSNNYGVPIGSTVRNQVGSSIVATLDKDLAKTLNLKAMFSLFTDYAKPGIMVPRLDILFTSKAMKYVNVNLGGTLFYDQTQSGQIQTSQFLSVGLAYNFSQFKK